MARSTIIFNDFQFDLEPDYDHLEILGVRRTYGPKLANYCRRDHLRDRFEEGPAQYESVIGTIELIVMVLTSFQPFSWP